MVLAAMLLTSQIFFSDIITVLLSTSKTNSTRVSAALLEQQCKSQILKKETNRLNMF